MYVAPSILSADFGRLAEEIRAVCEAGADLIHVDVMDGHFVPNLTIGPLVVSAAAKASSKPLDIHLMVKNVPFFVDLFLPLKPKFLSFHIEEETHPLRLIDHIRHSGVSPAVVLNPHTPLSALEFILGEVDMVLLMSVNPGFGGQKFIPAVVEKIKAIKKMRADIDIEVDGGITDETIKVCADAGANIFVAGSYVFSGNYKERIDLLKLKAK